MTKFVILKIKEEHGNNVIEGTFRNYGEVLTLLSNNRYQYIGYKSGKA